MSSSATLAAQNGHATGFNSNWLEWSVREFFTQVNWADQPPEVQAIQITTRDGTTPELSRQLTVSQFFSSIPWDGKAAAAPIVEAIALDTTTAPSAQNAEINVDDFADFF